MPKQGRRELQILRFLREADSRESVVEIFRNKGISQQTPYLVDEEVCRTGAERTARTPSVARREHEIASPGVSHDPSFVDVSWQIIGVPRHLAASKLAALRRR